MIAVDGRNIISGKQSWLRNDERMYILEPYGRGEFKGWRPRNRLWDDGDLAPPPPGRS